MNHDDLIFKQVEEHYDDALALFPDSRIVGIFLQGSQNYGLDYEGSDVDTKLIVVPTFEDIVFNRKPISTTHIRENEEHLDIKDLRLYFQTFVKQNLNFLEILFTDFSIVNSMYEDWWDVLLNYREKIAHMNPYRAVKSMKGIAMEKYHAMEHPYPSKMEVLAKWGYDCYHPDTLFLTNRGWLKYDEITSQDKLGTMNPQTFELEWQNYTNRISKMPTSNMYEGESYNTHFCITETHNVFTHKIKNVNSVGMKYHPELKNDWVLEPLSEALKSGRHRHIIEFPRNNQTDNLNFSDDLLKLFGAFISEGTINFRNDVPHNVRICQTNHGKSQFFTMMDSITSIPLNKYVSDRGDDKLETIWTANKEYAEKFLLWGNHGSKNKKLPNWIYTLSQRQADVLLKALWLGDGTEHKSRYIYYTSSKQLALDVCALANLAGYTSNVLGGDEGYKTDSQTGFGACNMWQVQITKRNENHTPSHMYFSIYEQGKRNTSFKKLNILPSQVVCFTVPNGLLITMYQGKTAVQGNCKQLHHLLRVEEYLGRYIAGEPYVDCLRPHCPEFLIDVKRGRYDLETARVVANTAMDNITRISDDFCSKTKDAVDPEAQEILNKVQYEIMRLAIADEFKYDEVYD